MAKTDHFALLITINRYPGLQDLLGPESDGQAFRDWLVDPLGGDLDPVRVRHIRSSDFAPADNPYDVKPTERELVRALDEWMRTEDGWKEKVGTRLYLFLAGHGFTAGSSISDPALFSAVAQNGDTAHIAGYRYAAKIANAGFFDEIILVMDCCQDVLKASLVLEPTWSPPDRNQSANVKLMQAYGAPRGRKAFERPLVAGQPPRGLFSSVWIEALRSALPDARGWVTGQAVKNQVMQLWAQRYKGEANYDPPVRLPDSEDILIYRRPLGAAAANVSVDLSAMVTHAGAAPRATRGIAVRIRRTRGRPHGQPSELVLPASISLDAARDVMVSMPAGLYSLETSQSHPDLAFQVLPGFDGVGTVVEQALKAVEEDTPVKSADPFAAALERMGSARRVDVTLGTSDPSLEIVVVNANFEKVAAATGTLRLDLPGGIYKALVKGPGVTGETLFRVGTRPLQLNLAPVEFASAAPLEKTTTTHEYQRYPAIAASIAPPQHSLGKPDGELFVFVRDSGHVNTDRAMLTPWPWQELRIESLTAELTTVPFDGIIDARAGFSYTKVALPKGTYALVTQGRSVGSIDEVGLAAAVVPGWRTEIYLDCKDEALALAGRPGRVVPSRVLDWSSASMFLVATGTPSLLDDPLGRSTEVARLRLASGRLGYLPSPAEIAKSPMLGVFASYAALAADPSDMQPVERHLSAMPKEVRSSLPDARLLDTLQFGMKHGIWPTDQLVYVPILTAGWDLMAQRPYGGLADESIAAVGQWRLAGSVWTHWKQPLDLAGPLREQLRLAKHRALTQPASVESRGESRKHETAMQPPLSVATWKSVLSGLERPDLTHSPFQQALRRRILDEMATGALSPHLVTNLSSAFGLSPALAASAYADVYARARALASARALEGPRGAADRLDPTKPLPPKPTEGTGC